MSATSKVDHLFNKLHRTPVHIEDYYPKPIFYPDIDSNVVIISTQSYEDNPSVFTYNLNTNETEIICQYDNNYHIECHGHFIDYKNDTLCTFGGTYDTLMAVNLKSKKINVGSNGYMGGSYVTAVSIPATNQI